MFGWIRRLFGREPLLTEAERVLELRSGLERRLLESTTLFYDNLVDPREPLYDQKDFYPVYGAEGIPINYDSRKRGEAIPVYLTELGLKQYRDQSRKLLAQNEFALNASTNRVSYTVGKGFQVTAVATEDDPETEIDDTGLPSGDLAGQVQAVLDEFIARTAWGERQQETVMRCDRDGEAFLRLFHVGNGRTEVRFVEPEHVKDMTGRRERLLGVITDPEDVETVLGYSVVENPDQNQITVDVPADEVVHIKLNTDSSAKRGLPTLYPVRKNLERAEKLLRNMSILAQVQATFALIRKHKGTGKSAVETARNSQADVNTQNPWTGRNAYFKQMAPGSIIDSTENTDFEFPASTVNAPALTGILQAELRAVAARLVMPEYMLTVDASNANYSSTLVAEAPAVKNFELLQEFYARRFGDGGYTRGRLCGLLWRVVAIAVREGLLPARALTDVELQVEGPQIVSRDKDQETRRAESLNKAGVVSKRTWAKWEGVDYDQEQAQIEQDGEQQGGNDPFGFGDDGDDPDGGSEGDDPFGSGDPTARAGGGADFQESKFSGRKKDRRGRTVCYADGRRVPCGGDTNDRGHTAARERLKRLAANPRVATPNDISRAADAVEKLTAKEAQGLAREFGIKVGKTGQSRQRVAQLAAKAIGERERFAREAVKAGIDPRELFATSKQFGESMREHLGTVQAMLKSARKEYASEFGKQLTRNHKAFRGGDYTDLPGFERLARSLADRYPELLGNHGYERGDNDSSAAAAALYDYLYAGTPKPLKRGELHQQALDYLRGRTPADPPTARASSASGLPDAISSSLEKAPKAKRETYRRAATEATAAMPEGARGRMDAALKGIDFHADAKEIGPAMIREVMKDASPEYREHLQGVVEQFESGELVAGGCYSPATGRARLDGDAVMPTGDDGRHGHSGTVTAVAIYAHEFGHAIDQGGGGTPLSQTDEWADAYEREIQHHDAVAGRPKEGPPPLSRYATTQPAEGFAEFARLVYASDVPHSQIRDEFPLASEFFQSQGLWPEQEREGGEGAFFEAFGRRVDTDEVGGHIDTLYDDEVPF